MGVTSEGEATYRALAATTIDLMVPGNALHSIPLTADDQGVNIAITDNGVGITQENLTRIFAHGFTTRKDGHGFGLHSGALSAKELGGALSVQSDGPGRGATFTLKLPYKPEGSINEKFAS